MDSVPHFGHRIRASWTSSRIVATAAELDRPMDLHWASHTQTGLSGSIGSTGAKLLSGWGTLWPGEPCKATIHRQSGMRLLRPNSLWLRCRIQPSQNFWCSKCTTLGVTWWHRFGYWIWFFIGCKVDTFGKEPMPEVQDFTHLMKRSGGQKSDTSMKLYLGKQYSSKFKGVICKIPQYNDLLKMHSTTLRHP